MSELDPVTTECGTGNPACQDGQDCPSPTPPPPPAPRRGRGGVFAVGALSGCAIAFVLLFMLAVLVAISSGDSHRFAAEKVAVVPIEGEIVDAREAVEALHRYAENTTVKAIVMRINSPGGAVAPSQEIYEAIRATRTKSGKPIVASLDSVAASGGFYIASACDPIISNPGSITGSIGVIMQWMETKDLLAWAKLKPETIKAGALKDAGSPYRDLTDAERNYFQHVTDQLHGQFIRAVAEGRKGKMTVEDVGRVADGRIFTGEEALALKLVDKLGNLDDAIAVAAKMAKVEGEPGLIYPKHRTGGLFDMLTDTDAQSAIERVLSGRSIRFLYKWN
jgi:protease-4